MTLFNLRLFSWLTIIAGSIAALWVMRRRKMLPPPSPAEVAPIPPIHIEVSVQKPARQMMLRLMSATSCLTLCIAALVLQSTTPVFAPQLLLVGAAGLGMSLFLNPPALPRIVNVPYAREGFRRWQAGLGVLCILALTLSNLAGQIMISSHVQFLMLVIGIGLVIYGFGGKLLPLERGTLILVGGITIIALSLRLIGLDSAVRFFIDEANFADGTRIALVSHPPLLARFSEITSFPWVYPYMESVMVSLFGRNLFSLRLVSALFGTLTIPAVYMLARGLFNKPTALAAALLLATFPPHIHFSRIAINNIADPLFGTLSLGWLAWGWRTGRRGYFALAGGALGLTQYFYDGGRLLYPPLLIVWMVGCLMLLWMRGEDRRERISGVLVMLLVAFSIAAPIYIVSASQGQAISQRYDQESVPLTMLPITDIVQRTWSTFLLYIQSVEDSFYYLGATPLLLAYTAAPFLIGLLYAIWRTLRLDDGGLLLVLWIGLTCAGNVLLARPFWSARYVVAFPALMLTAALGLYLVSQWVVRREAVARPLLVAMVVIIAVMQSGYYFAVHVPMYNDQSRLYEDSQDAAFRSANFPTGTQVHIIADPVAYHTYARTVMAFLRDDVTMDVIAPQEFTGGYMEQLEGGVDHAFFVLPGDDTSQRLVQQYFTVSEPLGSPYLLPPDREFWLLYAPQAANLFLDSDGG